MPRPREPLLTRVCARAVAAYLRAAGFEWIDAGGALRERVRGLPAAVRIAALVAAWGARWLAPLLLRGRPRSLGALAPADREAVLARLQRFRRPPLGALALALDAAALPAWWPLLPDRGPESLSPLPVSEVSAAPAVLVDRDARVDALVVGSGAGGSAVAAELASAGWRVVVAERGPMPRHEPAVDAAMARWYEAGGFTGAFGGGILPVPHGRCVGGTTEINSGTCLRPPMALLEAWEARFPGRFDAADFGRLLDEVERRLGVAPTPSHLQTESARRIAEGARALFGIAPHVLPRCAQGCAGSGRCCFGCPRRAKATAFSAFLEPALRAGHAELWSEAELVALRRARRGGPLRATLGLAEGRARVLRPGVLVLAAGALATPCLVRRFGLGPRAGRAGRDLSLHPASEVLAVFDEPVTGWRGVPQGTGFVDPEDEALRYEGAFLPPRLAPMAILLPGERRRWWIERYDHVAAFGMMVRDEARGRVRASLRGGPSIRYRMSRPDVERLLRGAERLARIFFAAGARRVLLPLRRPGAEIHRPEDLEAGVLDGVSPAELLAMAFHPLGTCGMGRVVDADLKLGEHVYVADGSVVPDPPGVNPQLTIYAFALRLARHLAR